MNIWPQAGIISLLISLVCSGDLFASCEVGGLEAGDPWRAPICGSRPQRCQAKIEGFLQLQSVGQGSTSEQRPIQNMSSPALYLFFIRMMYMINVALFGEVSCQSLALHLFFFFYAALGEESLDFGKRMAEKIRKTAPHWEVTGHSFLKRRVCSCTELIWKRCKFHMD